MLVVGAVLLVYLPQTYVAIAHLAGANAEVGLDLFDISPTLVWWTMIPVGASLIGAAVVIQALAPDRGHSHEGGHTERRHRLSVGWRPGPVRIDTAQST